MAARRADSFEAFAERRRRRAIVAVCAGLVALAGWRAIEPLGPVGGAPVPGDSPARVDAVLPGPVLVLDRPRDDDRLVAVTPRGIVPAAPRAALRAVRRWTAGRRVVVRAPPGAATRGPGPLRGRISLPGGRRLAERLLLAGLARCDDAGAPRRYELLEKQARHDGTGVWRSKRDRGNTAKRSGQR